MLDPGSFRDPSNRVYIDEGRVFRAITLAGAPVYEAARDWGLYEKLALKGLLLPANELPTSSGAASLEGVRYVLEHPRIPFVAYPYEWSFALHRAAALLHLDLHLKSLEEGFMLSDASAYNVQFLGTRPVFIDHLSLRPYREGEVWAGHRQYCMQFLNPLLFWSKLNLPPNHWFRGRLEGIAPEELAPLLPLHKKLSWTVLTHVVVQAALQHRQVKAKENGRRMSVRLPRPALVSMLTGLRDYISRMKPPSEKTVWADYASNTSYGADAAAAKRAFVEKMVSAVKPSLLFDLGCNTGDYSEAALSSGASYVVGFDFDHATLDRAFRRFDDLRLPFLPLWMDAANPSPSQGWAQAERRGFHERASADALVALAFIHHLAIGRNVPLPSVIEWIIGLAPTGIIEFPPKTDPMVRRLLMLREDVFADYREEVFLAAIRAGARLVQTQRLSGSERILVWYDRRR